MSDSDEASSMTPEEVQAVLEENDGYPVELLKHNQIRYALAESKHNPNGTDYLYDTIMGDINWSSPDTMIKSRFNDALDDLWDEKKSEGTGKSLDKLAPHEFYDQFQLSRMDDRELAYHAYRWITRNMHVTAIADEDGNGDVLHYEGGIWTDNGAQAVKHQAIRLLRKYSSTNVANELLNNHIKSRPQTNVDPDILGLDSGYVAVKNGLLDLDAGEVVRDLQPEDYAITQIPWEYDPTATCPTWERFITESVEERKQDLIQEYVGYCLLRGEYHLAKALMLLGDGRNGKTTFLKIVEKLLGEDENVMNADLAELAGGRFSAYRLEGKLANINADIENGEISHTSMFKNMTGGDAFQVQQKYGDPYDHQNSAKLIFAANQIPDIDTDEMAFYRRWLLVRFPHTFTLEENDGNPTADPELKNELAYEMKGILRWAVKGYQRLADNNGQFTNAMSPEEVREQWYNYANPMEVFCRDYLVEDPARTYTSTSEIHKVYKQFMTKKPSSPAAKKQLTAYIKKRFDKEGEYGVKKDDDGKSERGFDSVHVKQDELT